MNACYCMFLCVCACVCAFMLVTDPSGSNAHKHLQELRAIDSDEWYVCFASSRFGQQSLSCSWGSRQDCPLHTNNTGNTMEKLNPVAWQKFLLPCSSKMFQQYK